MTNGATKPAGRLSNLQMRIISAVVLGIVVLALTWLGGAAFRLLCAVIAAAIFYEWTRMSRPAGIAPHQMVAAALLAVVLLVFLAQPSAALVFGAAAGAVALCALDSRLRGQQAGTTVGLAYAALSGISLALLRDDDREGLMAMLFLFATVWATDIMAYFVGRALGGPRLAPAISPGKTWSGAIGGAAGGVLAGGAVAAVTGHGGPALLVTALLLSVVSQVGDLFESWVKRRHGVKDSSGLIPGHGGVMDRVDGLVAAAFVLYLIGALLGGADRPAHGLFVL
ncbi:phosphatidate cytidylyltransferase [Mesorhizobium sp. L-8-10]|nr:phosphatidate cytidylyltransferase [Mesorhizobium sp. L-8-10]